MARFVLVVALFGLCLATALAARRNANFRMPPNTRKDLSDEEKALLPKFQKTNKHRAVLPASFDARAKWPNCVSIKTVRNQGQCGTCWAVSSTSVLSDRICIASGSKIQDFISAVQAASCTQPDSDPTANCEDGGDPQAVYKHAVLYGIQTGGEYNSKKGCAPYLYGAGDKGPISCQTSRCPNSAHPTPLPNDGKLVEGYWAEYSSGQMSQTQINDVIEKTKQDLFANGPVTMSFIVWTDFQDQEASDEPYCNPSSSARNEGGHAVKVIGWGVSPRGTRFWMISNSWGESVGDKGIYRIEMGKNCVGIEHAISAPLVVVPNTCTAQSFCDKAIDTVVQLEPANAASNVYLFQGNCSLQVKVGTDGKLTPTAAAEPFSKRFLGAPAGPIKSYIVQEGNPWIINEKGDLAANCKVPSGAKSAVCDGTGHSNNAASPMAPVPQTGGKWTYYSDNKQWLFDKNGSGWNTGTALTGSFSKITGLQNVDGKKLIVFGLDLSNNPAAGVLNAPTSKSTPPTWAVPVGPQKNLFTKCSV